MFSYAIKRKFMRHFQKQPRDCSVKTGVFKNFENFTEKYRCWGLFLTLLKRDSNTGIFLWTLQIFKNTYSEEYLRTTASVFLKSKLQIMKFFESAENFISNFRIYKIFSYLLSFKNFRSTKLMFAFASFLLITHFQCFVLQ